MSFIRTKDGILKVEVEAYMGRIVAIDQEGYEVILNEKDVIAQSDNLAELCDGFIEKCFSGNRFHDIWDFNKQEAIKVMNIDINKNYKEFYFGIFVERKNKIDFISVAKLNKDGDLELI